MPPALGTELRITSCQFNCKNMKISMRRGIEIVLVLIMIVCFFTPFVYEVIPFDYVFSHLRVQGYICVTLPICLLIPFLLVLIFQKKIESLLLKILYVFSGLLFLLVFGGYLNMISERSDLLELEFLSTLLSGLTLLVTSLIFSKQKIITVQNILLATLAMPMVFHMPFIAFEMKDMDMGGIIMEASFILLYIIGLIKCFRD